MAIPRRKKNTLSNRQIVMIIAQDNQSNGTCTCVRVYLCKCVRAFASAQPMIEVISGNFGSISPARWSAHEFTFWCPTPKVCNINSVAGRAAAAAKNNVVFARALPNFLAYLWAYSAAQEGGSLRLFCLIRASERVGNEIFIEGYGFFFLDFFCSCC